MSFRLLGVGSPLVDYSLAVTENFLQKSAPCTKGATVHISPAEKTAVLNKFDGNYLRTPGGSAANTLRTFTALGGQGSHFGKTGNDDDGNFFTQAMILAGCDDFLILQDEFSATGYCLTLVTPDGERTMLSDLGASLRINENDLKKIDFSRFNFLLLEGYLIREPWIPFLLEQARNAGCKTALDLNNFEMVSSFREIFRQVITSEVSLLLANEAEMQALFPGKDQSGIIAELQKTVPLAVFKRGENGALIVEKNNVTTVPSVKTAVKDTTGAGDFFAAGFFYGLSKNLPYHLCGRIGAMCAGAIIAENGTVLNDEVFNLLKHNIENEVKNELQSQRYHAG